MVYRFFYLMSVVVSILFFDCCSQVDKKKEKIESNNKIVQASVQQEDSLVDMLNTVLEYPLVSQYFHFEENDKFAIYQNELFLNRIIKFKDNRFFLTKEVNKTTPYIEFTQFTKKKDRQSYIVLFVIPYEGIKGKLELEKINNKWIVKSNKIIEN